MLNSLKEKAFDMSKNLFYCFLINNSKHTICVQRGLLTLGNITVGSDAVLDGRPVASDSTSSITARAYEVEHLIDVRKNVCGFEPWTAPFDDQ